MHITDFNENHIKEALLLAKVNYEEERRQVPLLPEVDTIPGLSHFAKNGLGVAAFENETMLGYMCCYQPIGDAYGTTGVKGTYSSLQAHGAVKENRSRIYKQLYQVAAEKWVKTGIASHAIGLYGHDEPTVQTFFTNGFGLRTIEAVRPMDEIRCLPVNGYSFRELEPGEKMETLALKNHLISHLGGTPMFMPYPKMDEKNLEKQFEERKPRNFVAYHQEKPVAWIEVTEEGENFASHHRMQNICGAFCLPEHRSKNVSQNLLNYLITTLKNEGHSRLGVDFESFNPNAYGFWLKYFTPYLYGVMRRIDDKAVKVENQG